MIMLWAWQYESHNSMMIRPVNISQNRDNHDITSDKVYTILCVHQFSHQLLDRICYIYHTSFSFIIKAVVLCLVQYIDISNNNLIFKCTYIDIWDKWAVDILIVSLANRSPVFCSPLYSPESFNCMFKHWNNYPSSYDKSSTPLCVKEMRDISHHRITLNITQQYYLLWQAKVLMKASHY